MCTQNSTARINSRKSYELNRTVHEKEIFEFLQVFSHFKAQLELVSFPIPFSSVFTFYNAGRVPQMFSLSRSSMTEESFISKFLLYTSFHHDCKTDPYTAYIPNSQYLLHTYTHTLTGLHYRTAQSLCNQNHFPHIQPLNAEFKMLQYSLEF